MHFDPTPLPSSFGRLGRMLLRNAWAIVLLLGLAGCATNEDDLDAVCLLEHPGDVRCCDPGGHVDNGTCCGSGMHAVSDVDHPDWRICVYDDCTGASADPVHCQPTANSAGADAGADAS